ncbi:carbon-nitrogen hydrolase [Xylariaceae sp. FL0804]|nr:carbon-nitrogen hydrolase [Xylariaceae sp. FL0804]
MAKAAIGQICSSNSVAHNLEQCAKLVARAAGAGAKILFLPEASDYISTSAQESLALARPIASSPFVAGLRDAARRHALPVHVGIHVPVAVRPADGGINPVVPTLPLDKAEAEKESAVAGGEDGEKTTTTTTTTTTKLYNRTIYIDADGSVRDSASYDKLHLFDYGALRESATTQAGASLAPPIDSPVGRLGSLICFDVRFAEPAVRLTTATRTPPAQVLLYPSAFTVPTGAAHWELLLRARAVETQSWVIAAAQVGLHNPGRSPRVSYGRSMVVDPWGRVALELKGVRPQATGTGEEGYVAEDGAVGELGLVDVDLGQWEKVRERMPLIRRTDVYPEI